MAELTEVASGLRFPEGPVAMADGSVLLVEMFGPRVTRIAPDGTRTTVAEIPGGPNGAAIGPDGALYLCNNGGCFTPVERDGLLLPGPFDADRYLGGRIQRVDLATGAVTDLYPECDGHPLRSPNDLVFDAFGGFWFTDHGIRDGRTQRPHGHLLRPAGRIVDPGGRLSGRRAERHRAVTGRVRAVLGRDPHGSALRAGRSPVRASWLRPCRSTESACLAGLSGLQRLDSLAVDGDGNVCVATLLNGGITVISPDGEVLEHVPTGDPLTTNICFGGPDLRTAFVTASGTGRLLSMPWPRAGLALAHQV